MISIKEIASRGLNQVANQAGPLEIPLRAAYAHLFPSFVTFRNEQQHLIALQRLLKPDTCTIDIGCHAGDFLKRFVESCPQGQHYAFEPLPDLYGALESRFGGRTNVTVINKAVAETEGLTTFYWSKTAPRTSSLRRWDHPMQGSAIDEIKVLVTSLDSEIPATQRIDYIKIDVEGAELQVIQGARQLLTRQQPIVCFEHHSVAATCFGSDISEALYNELRQLDYDVFTLGDWLQGSTALEKCTFLQLVSDDKEADFLAIPRAHSHGTKGAC